MEWPGDKVERRSVADLVPYANNARTHSDEQVAQIARSITEFGFTMPILVDEANLIIAGHGRALAAKLLGLAEVPVIVARGWTDAQRRAYTIADNQLTLSGGWDPAMLRGELLELKTIGFDLALTGFDAAGLAGILDVRPDGATDPDDVPDVPVNPVSRPGDLWVLGRHRLLCGDSTKKDDVERVLGGVKPHLMVTDPPYGVSYDPAWRERELKTWKKPRSTGAVSNDDRVDWTPAWELFPGSIAYVWHGGLHGGTVQANLKAAGFAMRAQIIWAKQHFVLSRGDYHWQHEPCWYAVRGTGAWAGDRKQTTLWQIDNAGAFKGSRGEGDEETGHGTQKPVECMKRPIENNSSPGQAVYEPFSGSGTTIIAGEMTGRSVLAIEIDPAYVDVAVKRWQEFAGTKATDESGRAFDEVAAERQKAAA